MRIKNININQELKRIEKIEDYYFKVQELCKLSGLVAFYGHNVDNSHESLKKTEKMAKDTIELIIKRHNL